MNADDLDQYDSEEDLIIRAAATAAVGAALAVLDYSRTYYDKTPYHDSPSPASNNINTPPLVSGGVSCSSDVYSTPSHRNLTQKTRDALDRFYIDTYGDDSKRCLVTQKNGNIVIAHIVPRGSCSSEVR
jgi:hypothetical protein